MAYSGLTVIYNGLADPHPFIPGNLDLHTRDYGLEADGFTGQSWKTEMPAAYLTERDEHCQSLICGDQCTQVIP
jgi:hypothetical protein